MDIRSLRSRAGGCPSWATGESACPWTLAARGLEVCSQWVLVSAGHGVRETSLGPSGVLFATLLPPRPTAPQLFPLISTLLLQRRLVQKRGLLLLPGDSRPLVQESWRTEWPSPKSSCLSRFITPTTRGVCRSAGLVVIFHVINKDSFV